MVVDPTIIVTCLRSVSDVFLCEGGRNLVKRSAHCLLTRSLPVLFAACILTISKISSPGTTYAQEETPPTPLSTSTPLEASAPTTGSETLPSTPEPVASTELVQHFERVTARVMTISTLVVTIVAGLGGLGVFLGFRTQSDVRELGRDINKMRDLQRKLTGELEKAEKLSNTLINRYRYLVECRDPSAEVRKRAVQQLAYSKDIGVVSLIIDVLHNDPTVDVRIEAAFALGELIKNTRNVEIGGRRALLTASRDRSSKVQLQVVESFDILICADIPLPREAYERLKEIVSQKKNRALVEAAERSLAHRQQQLENQIHTRTGSLQ